LIAYFEIYEPASAATGTTAVSATMKVVDAKTGETKELAKPVKADSYRTSVNPAIPMALNLPIDKLSKGEYRLEVQATDSAGNSTPWDSADFAIEK
jgi:predicted phage tail protein